MKKVQWYFAMLTFVALSTGTQAQDIAALAENPADLAAEVADATLTEAASLLGSVLSAIDKLPISENEKNARNRAAITAVFGAFEWQDTELAEALGLYLGHGSAQLMKSVALLLDEVGYNAAVFMAAADAVARGGEHVPPPISLQDPSPPPVAAPVRQPPRQPPVAPPYRGQQLP